ncbi:MAG: hypothetical protein LBE37_17980 [Sphingobacterium sp.]|jgi:hypothetical protein|nr:hypothetical protein [Sphingobacterium sp.]
MKKEAQISLSLNFSQGESVPSQWMDRYNRFVLVGYDIDLLDKVALLLENEGKEVRFYKDSKSKEREDRSLLISVL